MTYWQKYKSLLNYGWILNYGLFFNYGWHLNYDWLLNYSWFFHYFWLLDYGWLLIHGWLLNYGWLLNGWLLIYGWLLNYGWLLKIMVDFLTMVEFWNTGRGTNKQTHKHTHRHINTMTWPGLRAGLIEKVNCSLAKKTLTLNTELLCSETLFSLITNMVILVQVHNTKTPRRNVKRYYLAFIQPEGYQIFTSWDGLVPACQINIYKKKEVAVLPQCYTSFTCVLVCQITFWFVYCYTCVFVHLCTFRHCMLLNIAANSHNLWNVWGDSFGSLYMSAVWMRVRCGEGWE